MAAKEKCPVKELINSLQKGERERMYDRVHDICSTPYTLYLLLCSLGYEGGYEAVEDFLEEGGYRRDPIKRLNDQSTKLENDIARLRNQMDLGAAGAIPLRPGEGERALASLTKELRSNLTEADRMSKRIDRSGFMLAGADLMGQELMAAFDDNDEIARMAIRAAFDNVSKAVALME